MYSKAAPTASAFMPAILGLDLNCRLTASLTISWSKERRANEAATAITFTMRARELSEVSPYF